MNTRNWSIRSKIIALVAVPIAALLALWVFATTLTVGPASDLLSARSLLEDVGRPGERLVAELQAERRLSLMRLAGAENTAALTEQRARTDQAVGEFRRRSAEADLADVAHGLLAVQVRQTLTALDTLPAGRDSIDRRTVDRTAALGFYSSMIDTLFRATDVMIEVPDAEVNRQARTLTELGQAREVLARTDALVAGALTAGALTDGEYAQLVQLIGVQRFLYREAVADLDEAGRVSYQRMAEGADFAALDALQDRLVAEGRAGRIPVAAGEWQRTYDSVQRQLRDFELARADALAERSVPVATGILLRLGLAGVLGLLAVALSAFIALRVGRSLVRRLTGLRAAALRMAEEQLPAVMNQLRRGEAVDIAQECPELDDGSDEIGQLGQAFTEMQRRAVSSAVDQATLRRGLSEVFLNIARRSQTLLHRQLSLLDRIERRVEDPDELAELFRIDHLATRMRRHAEDLVILAGAAPGRGWRNPVSMIDVVRGAISEVEEYARVDIATIQPAATAGRAVGDVIHLLAELIENATSFSPSDTRVQITGQAVAKGYAIEVEDRGQGMSPEELAEANSRLSDPPDFDPTNSARLGLFVVAQLAARHDVRVRLRQSPYGGVTAVVLIPSQLVVAEVDPLTIPDGEVTPGAAAGSGHTPGATTGDEASDAPAAGDSVAVGRAAARGVAAVQGGADGGGSAQAALVAGATRQALRQTAPVTTGEVQPSDAPPRQESTGQQAPVEDGKLPRRVRQASLAARMGGAKTPTGPVRRAARGVDEPTPRSPEEARNLMSALQAGTVRGRRDASSLGAAAVPGARLEPVNSEREA